MSESRHDDQCIEVQSLPMRRPWFFSVSEYEEAWSRARHLSPRGQVFWQVRWADAAPPVESLAIEWSETPEALIRVCDEAAYQLQMRRLLGLE
jgi:hypothetical protein